MTQSSYPYTNQATTDLEYSRLARELQDDGVIGSFGDTSLKVTGNSSGMSVSTALGSAILQGYIYRSSSAEPLTIAAADTAGRIDRIILRLDITASPNAARCVLAVKKGTPSASTPTAPLLSQIDGGIWEIGLATVAVPIGKVTIAATDVVDDRSYIGARIGVWDTEHRPISPRKRRMGFNETLGYWEVYNGTGWSALAPIVTWESLSGVPATFTPSAHSHSAADVGTGYPYNKLLNAPAVPMHITVAPTSNPPAIITSSDVWIEY
jgi:hypothetical protein